MSIKTIALHLIVINNNTCFKTNEECRNKQFVKSILEIIKLTFDTISKITRAVKNTKKHIPKLKGSTD